MSLTIRPSTPQDALAIKTVGSLAFAALRTVYRPSARAVASAAQRTDLGELVAVEDGAIVGVVRYREQDQRLHLIGLAVHPQYQRRGIARQIIEHLAELARHQGCNGLSLYTIEQTGNVTVFEKLGFRVLARTVPQDLESVAEQVLSEAFMVRPV